MENKFGGIKRMIIAYNVKNNKKNYIESREKIMNDKKKQINFIKGLLEEHFKEDVKVVYSEKNEWLILKTRQTNKTFGAVRFNKNTFASLYLDTKLNYNMKEKISEDKKYNNSIIDIQSRILGNFIQNKIKFFNIDQTNIFLNIINKLLQEDGMFTSKKVRNKNKTDSSFEKDLFNKFVCC